MKNFKDYNLENVLPHNNPMILIDEIVEVDLIKNSVVANVKINENKIFYNFEKQGMINLVGIEFMAQTIGVYAFFKNNEKPPQIGFLLGTRSFESNIQYFQNGETYQIKVREVFSNNELVSFDCFIYNDSKECAHAVLNAFQPSDAQKYLKEMDVV